MVDSLESAREHDCKDDIGATHVVPQKYLHDELIVIVVLVLLQVLAQSIELKIVMLQFLCTLFK